MNADVHPPRSSSPSSPLSGQSRGKSVGQGRFLLGLPYLANNELLAAVRRLGAPVLLSANAFSRWRRDEIGVPVWHGFNTQALQHGAGLDMALDSAGFVAAVKYRRFPWRVDEYIELCAAWPWRWFASQDMCVEPEAARDEETVLNRISATVRLNLACHREAVGRGIEDRLMPVIQGWRPDHYLRCIDRMDTLLQDRQIVGVGSMCRRHAAGPTGVLSILDRLDRAFGSNPAKLHLFGLKSTVLEMVAAHPRVASVDSQAYGVAARRAAIRIRETQPDFSKRNAFTAGVMEAWYLQQVQNMAPHRTAWRGVTGELELEVPRSGIHPFEQRYQLAAEAMRSLHQQGEIDFGDLNSLACFEAAFCCDEDGG